jgi:hypothetical protein
MRIHPYYRRNEGWMFDDPNTGLEKEGLVDGIDDALDLVTQIHNLNKYDGFDVEFSDCEIPHYDYKLIKIEEINGDHHAFGTYYMFLPHQIKGWLCPNLARYFDSPPQEIYLKVILE